MTIINKPKLKKGLPIKKGQPLSQNGVAETLDAIVTALENLDIVGGRVEWNNGRPRIILDKE